MHSPPAACRTVKSDTPWAGPDKSNSSAQRSKSHGSRNSAPLPPAWQTQPPCDLAPVTPPEAPGTPGRRSCSGDRRNGSSTSKKSWSRSGAGRELLVQSLAGTSPSQTRNSPPTSPYSPDYRAAIDPVSGRLASLACIYQLFQPYVNVHSRVLRILTAFVVNFEVRLVGTP